VWGKRKAVGRKHSMRFEPLNFEIEVGQEEAVWWGKRGFLERRQRRGRGKRELAPGKGGML
jgi:hypothetical protein